MLQFKDVGDKKVLKKKKQKRVEYDFRMFLIGFKIKTSTLYTLQRSEKT